MIVVLIIAIICIFLLIIMEKSKKKNPGVPMLPGAWPIVGHIPLGIGDNIKLYKTIDKVSKASIENGGSVCVSLGVVTDYYFFTNPDDCYAIMNASVEKHYSYSFVKPWLGEGLLTADPHKWIVTKKLLNPMFQQQNLNKFMTVFNKQARRLVKQFSEHVGKGPFDHEADALHISLETICQTAMGSNEGQLTARNQKFLDAITEAIECILKRFKKIWLHSQPIYEISTLKRELTKNVDIINKYTNHLLQKRKSRLKSESKTEGSDTDDFTPFVDTLIKVSQENKEFHDKQVIDEVNTLIFGGYDTTANTLMFAQMLLGHHQDVQDKVYKELTEVLGDTDRDLDKYDLNKLVYLEAFIKEVLRLYSAAPIVARNVYTNVKLRNCTIPAGTSCFISLYGLHRNPEWGVDAEVFNPDRWTNPETIPKNPNLFAPFGMGKRYCIDEPHIYNKGRPSLSDLEEGKTYAMMSLKTTLAHVVRNYRILADMNKLVTQMMVLLKPASGHYISLESRN